MKSKSGRDLAAERVRAGLTAKDLAEAMGVNRSRVSAIEQLWKVRGETAERYLEAVRSASDAEVKAS